MSDDHSGFKFLHENRNAIRVAYYGYVAVELVAIILWVMVGVIMLPFVAALLIWCIYTWIRDFRDREVPMWPKEELNGVLLGTPKRCPACFRGPKDKGACGTCISWPR